MDEDEEEDIDDGDVDEDSIDEAEDGDDDDDEDEDDDGDPWPFFHVGNNSTMKIMANHDVTHLESSIHLVVNVFQPATLNPRNISTAKQPFYQNLVRSILGTLRISSSLKVSNSQCDLQKRSKHVLPVHIVARNFPFS